MRALFSKLLLLTSVALGMVCLFFLYQTFRYGSFQDYFEVKESGGSMVLPDASNTHPYAQILVTALIALALGLGSWILWRKR